LHDEPILREIIANKRLVSLLEGIKLPASADHGIKLSADDQRLNGVSTPQLTHGVQSTTHVTVRGASGNLINDKKEVLSTYVVSIGKDTPLRSRDDERSSDSDVLTTATAKNTRQVSTVSSTKTTTNKNIALWNDDDKQEFWSKYKNVTNSVVKSLLDLPLDMGFQPEYEEEFPTVGYSESRIPHILHQIWITKGNDTTIHDPVVPDEFVPSIESFLKFNPDWSYMFWDYARGRRLIGQTYPSVLSYFDNCREPVTQSDLLRYVAVYEYGGLYADLDATFLRSLDIVTKKYSCILVPAPFENTVSFLNWPYHICNGIFFSKPKHPFFKLLLDTIAQKPVKTISTLSLGPAFFTSVYRQYQNISKNDLFKVNISTETTSPYFYKGRIPTDDINGIYIPNTRYFLDQPHPLIKNNMRNKCKEVQKEKPLVERLCATYKRRDFIRIPGKYTFIEHAYSFSFDSVNMAKNKTYVQVSDIRSVDNI